MKILCIMSLLMEQSLYFNWVDAVYHVKILKNSSWYFAVLYPVTESLEELFKSSIMCVFNYFYFFF